MSTETRPALPTAPASRTWTVELRYADGTNTDGTITDTVTAPTALGAVARLTAVLALAPEDVTAATVTAA